MILASEQASEQLALLEQKPQLLQKLLPFKVLAVLEQAELVQPMATVLDCN